MVYWNRKGVLDMHLRGTLEESNRFKEDLLAACGISDFVEEFKMLREAKCLTRADVYRMIGLEDDLQRKWEQGLRTPPVYVQILLIDFLRNI